MGDLKQVLRREEQAIYRLRALYQSFGYRPYKMNKFEEYDLYAHNKSFLQSEQILTFTDTDGRLMALKPDVTLSIIKNAKETAGLQKLCYSETVYRPSGAYGRSRVRWRPGFVCDGRGNVAGRSKSGLGRRTLSARPLSFGRPHRRVG